MTAEVTTGAERTPVMVPTDTLTSMTSALTFDRINLHTACARPKSKDTPQKRERGHLGESKGAAILARSRPLLCPMLCQP